MGICSEQSKQEIQPTLLYLRGEGVWWVGPQHLPWPRPLREGACGCKDILWRRGTGCSGSQPELCGGPEFKSQEDMGPNPVLGAEGSFPVLSHAEAHASHIDSGLAEAACCLGGTLGSGNLDAGPGGSQMREEGIRLFQAGSSLHEEAGKGGYSFLPGQLSPVLHMLYHRSLFSLTTEGKEADVQSQNHIQEKRLDTHRRVKKRHDSLVERVGILVSGDSWLCDLLWPRKAIQLT